MNLVSQDRRPDRSQPIARLIAVPIAVLIAGAEIAALGRRVNATVPIRSQLPDLTHRNPIAQSIVEPIAALKQPIAADRIQSACLKSCNLQYLSFGTITNPWQSEQLTPKTLYSTYQDQYLRRFGQEAPQSETNISPRIHSV